MNPHVTRPDSGRSTPLRLRWAHSARAVPCHLARGDEPPSIDWRDDYAGALEDARAANRLLWIQFTGPWCPNCTRMERDSFPHPAIVEHSQRSFVPLKLRSDLERTARGGLQSHGDSGHDRRRSQPRHHRLPPGLSGPGRARRTAPRLPWRGLRPSPRRRSQPSGSGGRADCSSPGGKKRPSSATARDCGRRCRDTAWSAWSMIESS